MNSDCLFPANKYHAHHLPLAFNAQCYDCDICSKQIQQSDVTWSALAKLLLKFSTQWSSKQLTLNVWLKHWTTEVVNNVIENCQLIGKSLSSARIWMLVEVESTSWWRLNIIKFNRQGFPPMIGSPSIACIIQYKKKRWDEWQIVRQSTINEYIRG